LSGLVGPLALRHVLGLRRHPGRRLWHLSAALTGLRRSPAEGHPVGGLPVRAPVLALQRPAGPLGVAPDLPRLGAPNRADGLGPEVGLQEVALLVHFAGELRVQVRGVLVPPARRVVDVRPGVRRVGREVVGGLLTKFALLVAGDTCGVDAPEFQRQGQEPTDHSRAGYGRLFAGFRAVASRVVYRRVGDDRLRQGAGRRRATTLLPGPEY